MYLKMNHLRKAEYHFRQAIEISPANAVLISCEGTVRAIFSFYLFALHSPIALPQVCFPWASLLTRDGLLRIWFSPAFCVIVVLLV